MSTKLIRAEKINRIKNKVRVNHPLYFTANSEKQNQPTKEEQSQAIISLEKAKRETIQLRQVGEQEYWSRIKSAEAEKKKITQAAEIEASNRINLAREEFKKKIDDAESQAKKIIEQAKEEAENIIKEVEDKKVEIIRTAQNEGYEQGKEKGLNEGKDTLNSMISHLKKIIGETINKRNEIIESSEKQLCNIAVIIAKKIVKTISETDKGVVLRNVSEALKKVKGRAKVIIRINISDLELVARHKDNFYRMLDNIENVSILEDPYIEKGGCIIETDFGDIDARVSAQLDEIETAVKNVQPIKDL